MALPELTLPDGFPAWLADGHGIELTPLYADVAMRTGHERRRRVYTVVPRMVSVGLALNAAQMLAFHDWFEGPMQAGAQRFSTQMPNQGPGLLWWNCLFADTYAADSDAGGAIWRVHAKLLLTGSGSVTGPYVAAMHAAVAIPLSGAARITTTVTLSAAVRIALQTNGAMRAAVRIALVGPDLPPPYVGTGYELREDGTYILREDGTYVLRETGVYLSAGIVAALAGSATATAPVLLAAGVLIPLTGSAAATAPAGNSELREDGTLVLREDGVSFVLREDGTSLSAGVSIALTGAAAATSPVLLAAGITAALTGSAVVTASTENVELREDGTYVLREDSTYITREI